MQPNTTHAERKQRKYRITRPSIQSARKSLGSRSKTIISAKGMHCPPKQTSFPSRILLSTVKCMEIVWALIPYFCFEPRPKLKIIFVEFDLQRLAQNGISEQRIIVDTVQVVRMVRPVRTRPQQTSGRCSRMRHIGRRILLLRVLLAGVATLGVRREVGRRPYGKLPILKGPRLRTKTALLQLARPIKTKTPACGYVGS